MKIIESNLRKVNNEVESNSILSEKNELTEPKVKEAKKSTLKIAKVKVAKPTVKKAATNKKAPGSKGRKSLNTQWDRIISDNMGTKENPKTSNELLQDLVNARDKKYILDEGNTKLIQRLNASLTKLYKQNKIGKQKIEGKKIKNVKDLLEILDSVPLSVDKYHITIEFFLFRFI